MQKLHEADADNQLSGKCIDWLVNFIYRVWELGEELVKVWNEDSGVSVEGGVASCCMLVVYKY